MHHFKFIEEREAEWSDKETDGFLNYAAKLAQRIAQEQSNHPKFKWIYLFVVDDPRKHSKNKSLKVSIQIFVPNLKGTWREACFFVDKNYDEYGNDALVDLVIGTLNEKISEMVKEGKV